MKDAYYFSHDSNSRNDPKCSALIAEYGMEGYGLFWVLVEMLSEQDNYKLEKFPKLYEAIAKQCSSTAEATRSTIEALIKDFNLLYEDEKYIWSISLLRRMEEKEKKRQVRVKAGRQGGIKSGFVRNQGKQNEAMLKQNEAMLKQNEAMYEANEPKESKVKESKVKESKVKESKTVFGEKIHLSEPEYQKLVDQNGEENTQQMIGILDNWYLTKGKPPNASDYHTMVGNGWVLKRFREDQQRQGGQALGSNRNQCTNQTTGSTGKTKIQVINKFTNPTV